MPLIREVHGGAARYEVVPGGAARVADRDALPGSSEALVSIARWQSERGSLVGRAPRVGVIVPSSAAVDEIAPSILDAALIAVEFPAFTDGRGYSIGRVLRERYRYSGELRAVGNVLRDQLLYMARCGFDAFEVDERKPVESWLAAFDELSVRYQPAADVKEPVWRRHARPFPQRSS